MVAGYALNRTLPHAAYIVSVTRDLTPLFNNHHTEIGARHRSHLSVVLEHISLAPHIKRVDTNY